MRIVYSILFFCLVSPTMAQVAWTWTELNSMPDRTSNNAVTEADVNGIKHVYSFGGIDTTKLYSGIHLKSYRYNTLTDAWDTIAPLPDTLGKIAAGASTVNNMVYIIGGYHVFSNGSEISSDKVHRYDPVNNVYLSDGAAIPIPIDDQVQAVWRDSLIFVVTGWSNNGNKPDVQIYNPYTDTWAAGTSTPNNNTYISFGASGVIIGDTIYYNGGVAGSFSFTSRPYLRKGIIDPANPTNITWSYPDDNPGDKGYRMAAASYGNKCFWIGGAGVAYNYDGIAYNGSGGVDPLHRILHYDVVDQYWYEGLGAPYGIMDLRGIARISPTKFIICGGMEAGQQVTNRAFELEYDPIAGGIEESEIFDLEIFPNPAKDQLTVKALDATSGTIAVYSTLGKIVLQTPFSGTTAQLDLSAISAGTYFVRLTTLDRTYQARVTVH
jgi:hypothetical protein